MNFIRTIPNPFNNSTVIEFSIPKRENTFIEVSDVLGRKVSILLNKEIEKGNHKINFDASNLSSGIYFYTISAGGFHQTRKMILLR